MAEADQRLMPTSPKQQCARPGCGCLVDRGYCPSCSNQGYGRDTRPTAAKRGYSSRWQKASKAFLQQHPIAVDWFHDHAGRVFRAEVVDHIIPHRGDMTLFWDVSNWQPLTKRDHDRKTALEDGGFGHTRGESKRMVTG